MDRSEYQLARTLFHELGPGSPEAVTALRTRANDFVDTGRYDEAEQALLEALALARTQVEAETPEGSASAGRAESALAGVHSLLAVLYLYSGRLGESETHARGCYDLRLRLDGPDHPSTLAAANTLMGVYRKQGLLKEAAEIGEATVAGMRRALGDRHRSTLIAIKALGDVYFDMGDFDRADVLLAEAYEGLRGVDGEADRATQMARVSRAAVLRERGDLDAARSMLLEVLSVLEGELGPAHDEVIGVVGQLATLDLMQGARRGAEGWIRDAVERGRAGSGLGSLPLRDTVLNYCFLLAGQGRHQQAAQLLDEALENGAELYGVDAPALDPLQERRAQLALDLAQPRDAVRRLEALLAKARSSLGEDEPHTLELGRALARARTAAAGR